MKAHGWRDIQRADGRRELIRLARLAGAAWATVLMLLLAGSW
jgi:hypothetical protein